MDPIYDLLKILLPASIVLYGMFLVVKTVLEKQATNNAIAIKEKRIEITLPLRLQAYERMCLYLERISPDQLIKRVHHGEQNIAQLQYGLVSEIREEFNHNLAQQVYMSGDAWNTIKSAKEEMIMLINQAAKDLPPEDKGIILIKAIYETLLNNKTDSIAFSIDTLRIEIQSEF